MKITAEHYGFLRNAIFNYLNQHPEVEVFKGLNSMRYRWDIYWAAGKTWWGHASGVFTNHERWHYLDDNNIDMALKKILREYLSMNPIGEEYERF